jgi:hypothetical protein
MDFEEHTNALETDNFRPISVSALAAIQRLCRTGSINRRRECLLAQALKNLQNAIQEAPLHLRDLAASFPAMTDAETAVAPTNPGTGEIGEIDE